MIICKKKSIYLKGNKVWRLSDKATLFWVDMSDDVRSIYKLCGIVKKKRELMKIRMTKIIIILMFCISYVSNGQSKIEEVTVDSNGKVISKTKIKRSENVTSEQTIEMFYKYQNDIEKLSPLISIGFYQKTPYYKLKEILKEKNKSCGKLIQKSLIKTQKSEDNNSIAYTYKITYQNIKTIEEIGLIKESGNYKVFIYNIRRAEN